MHERFGCCVKSPRRRQQTNNTTALHPATNTAVKMQALDQHEWHRESSIGRAKYVMGIGFFSFSNSPISHLMHCYSTLTILVVLSSIQGLLFCIYKVATKMALKV